MTSNFTRGAAIIVFSLAQWPATAEEAGLEGRVTGPEPDTQVQPAVAAPPVHVHPFAALAGSWTGGGKIDLLNDIHERLRCRANYIHSGNNNLTLSIRCASDNYKFELSSNVVERNGQISGQWSETGYGVSGSISGRVTGGRISAVAKGDSFNAALSVSTNGNKQSVTITPQATYIVGVQIGLSRVATAGRS